LCDFTSGVSVGLGYVNPLTLTFFKCWHL